MEIENFKHTLFNVVGKGTCLRGEIQLAGPTTLAGEVNGVVRGTDKIVLARTARVEGEIHAHDVEIHGFFSGEIRCSGTLSLRSGSEVMGVLKATNLVIYPGALVNMEGETGSPSSAT